AKIIYKFTPVNKLDDDVEETSSFSNISSYKILQYDLSQGYRTFLNQLFEDFYLVIYIETSYDSKHTIEKLSQTDGTTIESTTYNKTYNAYFLLFFKLTISFQNNQYVISSQRINSSQKDSPEIKILNGDTDSGVSVLSSKINNGYDTRTDLLSTSLFSISIDSLDVNILNGKTWYGEEICVDNMNTGIISIDSSNITSSNLIAGVYDNISISNLDMSLTMSVLDSIDTHASNRKIGSGSNTEVIFEYSPVATSTSSTIIQISEVSFTKVCPNLDFDHGDSNDGFVGKDNILDVSFVLKTKITLTSNIGEKECLNLYNVDEQTKSLFPEIFDINQGGYIVSDYVIYDGVTNFKDRIKVNSSENNVFSLYNSSNSNYSFLGNLGVISGASVISNTENSSYITTILSYLKFAYYKFDDNGDLNNNLFILLEGDHFNAVGYSDIVVSDKYALKLVSAEMVDDNDVLNLDNEFYNKNYVTVNKNNIYINGVLINLSKTYVVNDDELSSISDEHSTIIVSVFNNGFCLKYDNQEYLSIDIEFKKDDQLSTQPKSYIPFNIKSRPLKINVRNEENVEVINDKDWYGITYTDEVSYTGKYTRYFPLAEYIDSVQVKNSVSLGSGDKSNLDIEKVEVYLKKKNPAIDEAPYLNMYDYQSSHKLIKDIPTVSYDGNYYVNKATCSELIIKNKSFFVDLDSWIFSNGIEDDYFGTDPEKEIWSFDGTCFEDVVFGNKSYFYLNINIASGSENDFFNKNYEMHFNFSNIQSEDILTPQNNTYNHDEFGYVKKLSYNDRYLYLMQVTDSLFLDYPDLIINLSNYSITKY
ncbi:MAG: hypothetical protein K5765_00245, partial [Clostridia bacterium]|nr:hypothetical protein [Clostridia bacterium]